MTHMSSANARRSVWSDPKLPSVTVIAREVSKWGHIGATIGRETEGLRGYRGDAKPQVKPLSASPPLVKKVRNRS
jgi:hypothetical protein